MVPTRVDLLSAPPLVRAVWELLAEAAPTYLVGGAARDLIRGRVPRDWDLATGLAPEDAVARMRHAHPEWGLGFAGVSWGTVVVRTAARGPSVEVTSFRADGVYRDGRRPSTVRFGTSWAEDAARRDFTINALAVDLNGSVVDAVGGLADLEAGLVRAVGHAADRFREDPLRLWRAVRLLSQGPFQLEAATAAAVRAERPRLAVVAAERQGEELAKLLAAEEPAALARALAALQDLGVWDVLWPEWAVARGCPTSTEPIDQHCLATAVALPSRLRLAGLLHDIGKPVCAKREEGRWHFAGHAAVSALWAESMLGRLRFPRRMQQEVSWLVAHHGRDWDALRPADLRRLWVEVGPERLYDLLTLDAADGGAVADTSAMRARVEAAVATPYGLAPACSGQDVQGWLSLLPGRRVGDVLAHLQEWVLEHPEDNRTEALRQEAERWSREVGGE